MDVVIQGEVIQGGGIDEAREGRIRSLSQSVTWTEDGVE